MSNQMKSWSFSATSTFLRGSPWCYISSIHGFTTKAAKCNSTMPVSNIHKNIYFDSSSLSMICQKGKVKQIVGSTLRDLKEDESKLVTNFESDKSASEFANLYKEDGLTVGHVIMLGADPLIKSASVEALQAYPGGLQVGGGINSENCMSYIEEGVSHVIVTSYVFSNGQMDLERLKDLVRILGKQRLVLDFSCRKKQGRYATVTDRWQKFSDVYFDEEVLEFLASFADEFLVHGVDVEGKKTKMKSASKELLQLEAKCSSTSSMDIRESSLRIFDGKSSASHKMHIRQDDGPLTGPVPKSQVLGKVQDFLGIISEANKKLQLAAKENPAGFDIEVLNGNESEIIEMDLMLGIADLHTPEVVAAAESAVAGVQPNIPLFCSDTDSESEDNTDDDDINNNRNDNEAAFSAEVEETKSSKHNSGETIRKQPLKKRSRIVELS